jgi:hypothetical protein
MRTLPLSLPLFEDAAATGCGCGTDAGRGIAA